MKIVVRFAHNVILLKHNVAFLLYYIIKPYIFERKLHFRSLRIFRVCKSVALYSFPRSIDIFDEKWIRKLGSEFQIIFRPIRDNFRVLLPVQVVSFPYYNLEVINKDLLHTLYRIIRDYTNSKCLRPTQNCACNIIYILYSNI